MDQVHLYRRGRLVTAAGPDGAPLPPAARARLVDKLTYYERKYDFEAYGETGNRFSLLERRLYVEDAAAGRLAFPLGLRPRVAADLAAAGMPARYRSGPLAAENPAAFELDWDGLFADFEIYPGQDTCLANVVAADGGIIASPTGSGKSVVIRMLCRLFHKAKIHVVTKSATLADEIVTDLVKTIPTVGFVGGGKRRPGRVTVFIADSLQHGMGEADILLADECFVGDTQIAVPGGTRRIDNMRPGDKVYCATGVGVVEQVFSKPGRDLCCVEFANGARLTCTIDHPVFTDTGWIAAADLEGRIAFGLEGVRALWEAVPAVSDRRPAPRFGDGTSPNVLGSAEDLLAILCQEAGQPDEQVADAYENARATSGDQTQTYQAWRERAVAAFAAVGSAPRARRGVGIGGGRSDAETCGEWIPEPLQAGYRQPRPDDGRRDRRSDPQQPEQPREGCQKDGLPGGIRVVRVSRVERTGVTPVFNLRVRGHPSYFAEGILAHNCHELSAPKYAELLGRYLTARMFGFSATPTGRMDGRDLQTEALFGPVLYTMTYQDAEAAGRVVPITVEWIKPATGPNIRGINSPATRERIGVWQNAARNAAIAHRVSLFDPDEQVMVMVKTIDHGVRLKQLLPDFTLCYAANGMDPDRLKDYVQAGLLPADEPLMTRDRLKALREAFAAGTLKKVIANYVWSTGVNFRHLGVLVRADAAASEIRDGQIPGRVCRRVPGVKESALMVDVWDDWDPGYGNKSRSRSRNYKKRGWAQVFSTAAPTSRFAAPKLP